LRKNQIGKCASKNSKLEIEIINDDTDDDNGGLNNKIKKINYFNLESKILVYPNHEDTLSFIIEINFNSVKSDGNLKSSFFNISFVKAIYF
jgi:hypothetical protein